MWKQRAKVKWLKEGDNNTKFFHKTASYKRKKNFISGLNIDNGFTKKELKVREAFLHFLQKFDGFCD